MAREVTDFFVAVIGPYSVGKTALIMRFVTSQYPEVHEETLEEAYTKRVRLSEKEKTVLVEILDTAGHSNFFTLLPPVMKTYDGFVLVYDVTKKSSFDKIRDLVANIRRARGTDQLPPIVLAANKTDHKSSRVVSTEDGKALAGSLGMEYIETSAKNDENCEQMFHVLLRRLKDEKDRSEAAPTGPKSSSAGSGGSSAAANSTAATAAEQNSKSGAALSSAGTSGDSGSGAAQSSAPLKSGQSNNNQRQRPGSHISRPMIRQSSKNRLKDSDEQEMCLQMPNELCFGLCALQPDEVALMQSVYVQELARDKIPEDLFPLPVLALKNLSIEREFSTSKFIGSFCLFPFFPILVTYQTIGFVSGNASFFPGEWQIDYSKTKEWAFYDIFGLIIGRDPCFDPEGLKDRKYFILQSDRQKTARIVLTMLTWICAVIVAFNCQFIWRDNETFSIMETWGPILIYLIMWSLFCSWHAYNFSVEDQLPRLSRLRGMQLLFGDDYRYKTTVYTLLRAYWRSKDASYMLSFYEFLICSGVGALYSLIPGLVRVYARKKNEENVRRVLFPEKFILLTVGAFIVNFLFTSGFVYGMFRQYSGKFAMYIRWNQEITNFLSVNSNFKSTDEVALKEITAPVDDQGRHHLRVRTIHNVEIQRDLAAKAPPGGPNSKNSAVSGSASLNLRDMHLSFGRNHNIAGWLDLRAYLGMEGQMIFGEQELPTLWLVVVSMLLSLFLTFRVFFVSGNAYESALWNGMACLSLVCLVSLLLIASSSRAFQSLQASQERLFAEQKLILQCSHTIDDRGKLTKLEAGFAKLDEAHGLLSDQSIMQVPNEVDGDVNDADNEEDDAKDETVGVKSDTAQASSKAATDETALVSGAVSDDDPLFSDSDSDFSDDLDISQALPSSEDEAILYRAMSPDGSAKADEIDEEKKDEQQSLLPKRKKTKRIVKLRKRLKANAGAKLNFISTAADIVSKKAIMPNIFGFDTANVLIATVIFMLFMAFLCSLRLFVSTDRNNV